MNKKMDNKSNRIEKLLKYFTIFSWSMAIVTLILYLNQALSLFDFINDELTFILTPFIFKWLYMIWKSTTL
jgi:hypothetical protein